jgi:adenylyl-sulfate kinase
VTGAAPTAINTSALRSPSGCVVWLTGLCGAGKTTIARRLEARLARCRTPATVLDGDELRQGLCRDLGYSPADRRENVRRAAEMARDLADRGHICLVALISPFRDSREQAATIIGAGRFIEVHVETDIAVCERRDRKGLYARARQGAIPDFTGISSPYEPPAAPHVRIDTGRLSVDEACGRIWSALCAGGWIAAGETGLTQDGRSGSRGDL